ncbi:MAG: reverse transcriptase N-terminal domain-containing protein [Parahaliea sp.]
MKECNTPSDAPAFSGCPEHWHQIDWRHVNRTVRGMQVRIAKAARDNKPRRVSALQRMLTRSFCGKALAVRRVTENQGKRTAGVDCELWGTPTSKRKAIDRLVVRGYHPKPLRRVHIPKANGKLRALGIPTMTDRAMQALFLLALEPVSESKADESSYGFRQGRSTADAIMRCYMMLSRKGSAKWVLDADIEGCFDHGWLIDHIPMDKVVLRKWLKAGVVDMGRLQATEEGTPQGGIISPTLANMALDGLEAELAQHFGAAGSKHPPGGTRCIWQGMQTTSLYPVSRKSCWRPRSSQR